MVQRKSMKSDFEPFDWRVAFIYLPRYRWGSVIECRLDETIIMWYCMCICYEYSITIKWWVKIEFGMHRTHNRTVAPTIIRYSDGIHIILPAILLINNVQSTCDRFGQSQWISQIQKHIKPVVSLTLASGRWCQRHGASGEYPPVAL